MANAFEQEVQTSARLLGVHYKKCAVPSVFRRGRHILVKDNSYDSYIVKPGGIHIAVELKSKVLHGSFPLDNIQEHQLDGLAEMVGLGAPAYLVFNMRRQKKGSKTTPDMMAWALDFRNYPDLLNDLPHWRGKPRRSIPRDYFDLPQYFTPIPRISVQVPDKKNPGQFKNTLCWDIRVLL